ncbi:MAG: hybrid sensor histidine kinase/response regulator [Kofleriaceae bacterium]
MLVFAPRGRDAELIERVVAPKIAVEIVKTIDELAGKIDDKVGCAIVTQEALGDSLDGALGKTLARQPPWSDFPLIVLSGLSTNRPLSSDRGNITLLERPITPNTLLVAVRSALRARHRQYQARAAIEQRDQFLAMLGHELRNPLGAIVMASDLISADTDRASLTKRLGILSRQAHHLARLVDDLLDVARVTTGKVRLKREPIALDDIVRASLEAVSESAKARELALTVSIASGAIIDGDPVRIAQIANNLLGNAVKYSGNGKEIRIATLIVDDHVELRVADHGIGIEPEMLGRVFELFAQAESGLERSEGGMGIGLTLVDRLVRLHDGTVEAKSDGRGKGSEFIVRLPLSAHALKRSKTPVPIGPGAPVRAVVVEDSSDLRELTVALLEAVGCEVESAATGPDGLALILRVLPELAIVDVGLPGITGFDIAREVREKKLKPRLVLVAVTGYGRKADKDEAIAAGFDAHYAKPVQANALRELVESIRTSRSS